MMYEVCRECGLHKTCKSICIEGRGNPNPKLIIIGEAPGFEEDQYGMVFVGPTGKLLSESLKQNESDVYITNVVKCLPMVDPIHPDRGVRAPSELEIRCCKEILFREFKRFDPSIPIMTLGNTALSALVGSPVKITEEVGKPRELVISGRKFIVFPNYHPAYVLRNKQEFHKFESVTNYALGKRQQFNVTQKILNYEESLLKIEETLDLYNEKKIEHEIYDIETDSLSPFEQVEYLNGDKSRSKTVMVSFCNDYDPCSYVVPLFINNNFLSPNIISAFNIKSDDELIIKKNELSRKYLEQEHLYNELSTKINNEDKFDGTCDKLVACKGLKHQYHQLLSDLSTIENNEIESIVNKISKDYYMGIATDPFKVAKVNKYLDKLMMVIPLVGHNLKFDIKFRCVERNLDCNKIKVKDDTLIMAHQLIGRVNFQSLALKDLCRKFFDVKEDWEKRIEAYLNAFRLVKDRHFGNLPTMILGEYSGLDTGYNRLLYNFFKEKIPQEMIEIINEITRSTIPYVEAESKGMYTDNNMYQFLKTNYENYTEDTKRDIYNLPTVQRIITDKFMILKAENSKKRKPKSDEVLLGDCFSITSNKNVQELFYGQSYYATPISKDFVTPKGAPQTGIDAMKFFVKSDVASDEAKEFAKSLLKHKDINTLKTRYIDSHPSNVFEGFYRPEFNLTSTVTGRFSSGFHTLPSKSDVKRMFISRWREEGGLFLCADASQIEVRMGASLANEHTLLDAYNKGLDIHKDTAKLIYSVMWGRPVTDEEVIGNMRDAGKTMNFGVFYGKGVDSISEELGCTKEEAKSIINAFFGGKINLSNWIKQMHQYARKNGCIITPFGRYIPIPESLSSDIRMQSYGDRRSVNNIVQSSASDAMSISNNWSYYDIKEQQLKSVFLGTVQDSTEWDMYPGEMIKIINRIKYNFEEKLIKTYDFIKCKMVMDFAIGTSWGGAIEFKINNIGPDYLDITGKALSKDIRLFSSAVEKSYKIDKVDILSKEEVKEESFPDDIFVRDGEIWKTNFVITNR